MIPFGAVKYTILSAVLVISLLAGIRMIFAHDVQREAWRETARRYIYLSQRDFKRWSIALGWVFLLIGLVVAFFTALDSMD